MEQYSNIIVLRSVYGANGAKCYVQPMRDPKTGRFPEHVKRVDSHGDMVLSDAEKNSGEIFIPENQVFIIETGKTYNLDDKYDLAEWEAIKYCPMIAEARDARDSFGRLIIDGDGSQPNYKHNEAADRKARYGIAEFYIDRPGEEQQKKITRTKLIHNAKTYIFGDPQGESGIKRMCKILGKNMDYQSNADALEYMLKIAEMNPEKIINLYTGSDTNLRLLFVDALDKKVIKYTNSLYMFNETILGATQEAVITWMRESKNKGILNLIKQEVLPELLRTQPTQEQEEKAAERVALKEEKQTSKK